MNNRFGLRVLLLNRENGEVVENEIFYAKNQLKLLIDIIARLKEWELKKGYNPKQYKVILDDVEDARKPEWILKHLNGFVRNNVKKYNNNHKRGEINIIDLIAMGFGIFVGYFTFATTGDLAATVTVYLIYSVIWFFMRRWLDLGD